MEYSQDVELILSSMNKDKRELLDKVAEIDKLIKRIKYGNLNLRLSKGIRIDENIAENILAFNHKRFHLRQT